MVHAKEEMVTIEIIYNGSLLYYHDSTLGIHPDAVTVLYTPPEKLNIQVPRQKPVRNCTQSRHRTAVSQMTRVMLSRHQAADSRDRPPALARAPSRVLAADRPPALARAPPRVLAADMPPALARTPRVS